MVKVGSSETDEDTHDKCEMDINPSGDKPKNSRTIIMRLLQIAFFVAIIAAVWAYQLPFINSTGWMINHVPYDKRVYWMRQAKEAMHNASGPW